MPVRSLASIFAGIIIVAVLSVGTDMALVASRIFPPLNQPGLFTTPMLLAATAYRTVYGVLGGMITARLAPSRPIGHALVLGVLGLVASAAGAVSMWGYGPNWYPVALVAFALPTAWIGGFLQSRRRWPTLPY